MNRNGSPSITFPDDQYPAYRVTTSDHPLEHNLHAPVNRREYKTYRGAKRVVEHAAKAHPDKMVRLWGEGLHEDLNGYRHPNWYVVHVYENGELQPVRQYGEHRKVS